MERSTGLGLVLLSSLAWSNCAVPPEPPAEEVIPCADPGSNRLRRLNRTEYDNTVRDLLGDTSAPARRFPIDDTSFGFDTIAEVLSLSPLLFEKYDATAQAMASKAWSSDFRPAQHIRLEAESVPHTIGRLVDDAYWKLNGNGSVAAALEFQSDGVFTLSARAYGTPAGTEHPRMVFSIDGEPVAVFEVEALESSPSEYQTKVTVSAGPHIFSIAFDNYHYDDDHQTERALVVDWFQIENPAHVVPVSQARLRVCDPAVDGERPCAAAILSRLARQAWRRPVTAEELERLLALVDVALAQGDDWGIGIQTAAHAVLLSPHFLFRVELDADPASEEPHRVTDHELATRLSYFLWSSMPDEALAALADQGQLSNPEVLRAQVVRMLADPKAEALVASFAGQWLQLRAVPELNPSPALFPAVTDALKQSMVQQTSQYFREFLHSDRSALDLLDADFTYLDDALAAHYQLPAPGSASLTRVGVSDPRRRGLLSHASILALTSRPDHTSPVHRGKWVMGQLLCQSPPPPPPNVTALPAPGTSALSVRQQMERHRADPACASCHAVMDPIGLGLENYDAVGAWRTFDDEGFPVDAVGQLPGDRTFTHPAELAAMLKADPAFPHCMTRQLFTYALGRGVRPMDACHLEAMTESFAAGGHRLSDLLGLLTQSQPFTHRRGER